MLRVNKGDKIEILNSTGKTASVPCFHDDQIGRWFKGSWVSVSWYYLWRSCLFFKLSLVELIFFERIHYLHQWAAGKKRGGGHMVYFFPEGGRGGVTGNNFSLLQLRMYVLGSCNFHFECLNGEGDKKP
jgi:hypothetical protein